MISLVGNGTLAAITGFVVIGLPVGHVIGGPEPNNRLTLALFTAARNPGIAVTKATTNFPLKKLVLLTALLYLLVNALISSAYLSYQRKAECRRRTNLANVPA